VETGRKPPQEETVEKKKRQSQADELILLCLEQEPDFFYDQYETPYARIKQKKATVIVPLRSRKFKVWLASLMWKRTQKAPAEKALRSAINILQAVANENPRHTLHNRVAPAEDGIWLDMTDEKWRAIKVTAEGWEIVDNPPILFRRYSHQKPLAEPVKGGDYRKFFNFVNIGNEEEDETIMKEDEETELMITAMIIHDLIPDIPHTIPHPYGIIGSAKTFFLEIWRSLIDPSTTKLLSIPRDINGLIQQLSHHWCAFYDNLSYLPNWVSDAFCRASTGGGHSKRQLYTDDEDINIFVKNCVGLTGINVSAHRGDLLQRIVLFGLRSISEGQRKEEKVFRAEFEQQKPEILGGFLDLLVKTMKMYPTTNPSKLFRMADFTRWGCATARALEKTQEEFITAYENKNKKQIEESVRSSPVGSVLMEYMEDTKEWCDSPTKLLMALTEHAKNTNISTRQKAWPKAPAILTNELNYLKPNLKALGFEVITGIRNPSDNKRRIHIINDSEPLIFEDTEDGKIRKKIYECLKKHKDYTFADLQDFVMKNTPLNINQATDLLNKLIDEERKLGLSKTGYLGWV